MRGPALLSMRWRDLLFLHWPVAEAEVRRLVPVEIPIDTFHGSAWLSIVALRSSHVRPRGLPLPGDVFAFAQVNVRTYSTIGRKRGIRLLSVDCADRLTVAASQALFGVPYVHADVRVHADEGGFVVSSRRSDDAAAVFDARYRPTGPVWTPEPETLDDFLTNRLSLYASHPLARVLRADVDHVPWPLREVEATIEANTLLDRLGLGLAVTGAPARMHFSPGVDVLGGPPVRIVPRGK